MPPRPKVTREQIVNGALALVRRGGEAALTAKALAAELACSTQPSCAVRYTRRRSACSANICAVRRRAFLRIWRSG